MDIYIEPPEEGDGNSEEDSDNSDDEHVGDINHLPRGILCQGAEVRRRVDDEYEAEDLIPLAELFPQPGPSGNKKRKVVPAKKSHNWLQEIPNFSINVVCEPRPPSAEAQLARNPVDFFNLFFDEKLLDLIVSQTNIYAQQKNSELGFTKDELYVMLGALLLSGYAKYPHKRMFWNSTPDVPPILKNSMRLNRFETLLHHLHFNNNLQIDRSDKLFKIRPVIDALNATFRKHGGLDEHISIDESMIPYYGKHYAKQYIKGKPIRFGFKNWALCTSNGYMISFEIYTGKSQNKNDERTFGLGGDVVLKLLEKSEILPNEGYKVYFDNYFTSLDLLSHLSENNICATGTIRENRTGHCPFPNKNWWKTQDRGSYKFVAKADTLLVQWKDNKIVTVASNFENNDIVNTTRWCRTSKSKKRISQPKLIANYNKRMGGVDKMDGLIALYRSRIRQRKWYWPILAYLLDASISNAWLLMKQLNPADPNCASLLNFRRYVALGFLSTYGKEPSRGKTATPSVNPSRFDNVRHMIRYNESDRRCQVCKKKSNFICIKCDCGLHPKLCFEEFHTPI